MRAAYPRGFTEVAMTIEWPTLDQLLGEFAEYNRAIWAMQVVAYVLGASQGQPLT